MIVIDPMRLDYVFDNLRAVFASAVSDTVGTRVIWAHPNLPRPAKPFCVMQVLSGPSRTLGRGEWRYREYLDSVTVTVNAATASEQYTVRINGIPVRYAAGGGDTVTDIRDALVAAAASIGEPVTVAPVSTNQLTVTPDAAGDLVGVGVWPPQDITAVEARSDGWVIDLRERMTLEVQISAYSEGGTGPDNVARSLALRMQQAAKMPFAREQWHDQRVAVRQISGIRADEGVPPGAADIEAAASFDIEVAAVSNAYTVVSPIESASVTVNIGARTFTVEAP